MVFLYLFCVFILGISLRSVVFFIVSRRKIEKQWNKIFYNCLEVFEDSHIDPVVFCSFLTDPCKIMNFNYKNKIKSIEFKEPLISGSSIEIKIRKRYSFKGVVSYFNPESKIVFEYHIWPNATRYICELEMIRLENKTRYILRMKAKNILVPLLVPLIKRIFRSTNEKISNGISEILHNSLVVCEKSLSEKNQSKNLTH